MIRMLLVFLAMWGAVFFGASYFYHISRGEKLNIARMGLYSLATAIVALFVLVGIVVLF